MTWSQPAILHPSRQTDGQTEADECDIQTLGQAETFMSIHPSREEDRQTQTDDGNIR